MTALSPRLQALKQASRELVAACEGQTEAAKYCRLGQAKISECVSAHAPERFLPADAVLELEGVTRGQPGAPHVTRLLAREAGFALVPLPEARPADFDWLNHIACVSKEVGDVVAKLAREAKGGLTAAEIRKSNLRREVAQALVALVDLDASLAAVESG